MNKEKYQEICDSLEKLRLEGNPYWNASPEVVFVLESHVRRVPHCRMLEIGCSNGYTALRLVPALLEVRGTLITVESHVQRGNIAAENFCLAEVIDVVTLLRGHAPEIFSELSGKFDVVFLDATKYEHVSYVEKLLLLLSSQATIIADNISSHTDAMKPFVEYMHSLKGFSVEIKQLGTGLLVAEKRGENG